MIQNFGGQKVEGKKGKLICVWKGEVEFVCCEINKE